MLRYPGIFKEVLNDTWLLDMADFNHKRRPHHKDWVLYLCQKTPVQSLRHLPEGRLCTMSLAWIATAQAGAWIYLTAQAIKDLMRKKIKMLDQESIN